MAVKPIISLWNDSIGIYKINNFNIDANKASDRIVQYLKLAAGNNTTIILFIKPKNLKIFIHYYIIILQKEVILTGL